MATSPNIYFYIPAQDFPTDTPKDTHHYWVGFRKGVYCWVIQTYLNLQAVGFRCDLVSKIPEEGIILAHYDSLPRGLMPSSRQLIVCIQADRSRHPYAQVHIVENREGLKRSLMTWGDRFLLIGQDYFMPHWPQPGLIPRDATRGDRFENLGFFGLKCNLSTELQSQVWHDGLNQLGIKWLVVSNFSQWNDYSQLDAILAVRSFKDKAFKAKPASKLFNAWHAGVPAILGQESAYKAERKSSLDYLEVSSIDDTFNALKRLKYDLGLRRKMIENGQNRAQETQKLHLTKRWAELLGVELSQCYSRWVSSSSYRNSYMMRRSAAFKSRDRRKAMQSLRNRISIKKMAGIG